MGFSKKYFRIAEVIAVFFVGMPTFRDQQELKSWIQENPKNNKLNDELSDLTAYEQNQELLKRFPAQSAWENIKHRLQQGEKKRFNIRPLLKYTAILFLFLGIGILYWQTERNIGTDTPLLTQEISSGTKEARLILSDGRIVNITKENQFPIQESNGTVIWKDSTGIDYTKSAITAEEEVHNVMQTLAGMEYSLTLSDGTKVFLNAETRLEFPISFKGRERIVKLNGEAYFRVAKDAEHPFIVKTGEIDIKVVGTSFNIRSYEDEMSVMTTLVEGQVCVNNMAIVPGEQAVYFRETGNMTIKKVDTGLFTSWQEGQFIFRNERLDNVMKTLARWYNVEYHFLDEESKGVKIGAHFERYSNMSPILDMLKQTGLVVVTQIGQTIYFSIK